VYEISQKERSLLKKEAFKDGFGGCRKLKASSNLGVSSTLSDKHRTFEIGLGESIHTMKLENTTNHIDCFPQRAGG
jgi:hypothetical protein